MPSSRYCSCTWTRNKDPPLGGAGNNWERIPRSCKPFGTQSKVNAIATHIGTDQRGLCCRAYNFALLGLIKPRSCASKDKRTVLRNLTKSLIFFNPSLANHSGRFVCLWVCLRQVSSHTIALLKLELAWKPFDTQGWSWDRVTFRWKPKLIRDQKLTLLTTATGMLKCSLLIIQEQWVTGNPASFTKKGYKILNIINNFHIMF